jgi:hypothetical protein
MDNELKKKMQSLLENYEAEPQNIAWEAIKADIAQPKPNKLLWPAAAVLLLFTCMAGAWFLMKTKEETVKKKATIIMAKEVKKNKNIEQKKAMVFDKKQSEIADKKPRNDGQNPLLQLPKPQLKDELAKAHISKQKVGIGPDIEGNNILKNEKNKAKTNEEIAKKHDFESEKVLESKSFLIENISVSKIQKTVSQNRKKIRRFGNINASKNSENSKIVSEKIPNNIAEKSIKDKSFTQNTRHAKTEKKLIEKANSNILAAKINPQSSIIIDNILEVTENYKDLNINSLQAKQYKYLPASPKVPKVNFIAITPIPTKPKTKFPTQISLGVASTMAYQLLRANGNETSFGGNFSFYKPLNTSRIGYTFNATAHKKINAKSGIELQLNYQLMRQILQYDALAVNSYEIEVANTNYYLKNAGNTNKLNTTQQAVGTGIYYSFSPFKVQVNGLILGAEISYILDSKRFDYWQVTKLALPVNNKIWLQPQLKYQLNTNKTNDGLVAYKRYFVGLGLQHKL